MRQSQRKNLLDVIGFHPEGILWRDLIGTHTYVTESMPEKWHLTDSSIPIIVERKVSVIEVTRSTAARHLPQLIKDGLVQKTAESRKKGERGRQSQRYRLAPRVQETCRVPAIVMSVIENGKRREIPFFGFEKKRHGDVVAFQILPDYTDVFEANPAFAKALKDYKLRKRREIYKQHSSPPPTW